MAEKRQKETRRETQSKGEMWTGPLQSRQRQETDTKRDVEGVGHGDTPEEGAEMEMGGQGKPCRQRQSSVGWVASLAQLSCGPRLGCWPQQGQVKTLQRAFARVLGVMEAVLFCL